jgi:hypothetical protein
MPKKIKKAEKVVEKPSEKKAIHIIGGGTVSHVRSHMALSAPAYGSTAKQIAKLCEQYAEKMEVKLHLTKMADQSSTLETLEDVRLLVEELVADKQTKIIFMNAAIVDFEGKIGDVVSGKHETRLSTSEKEEVSISLKPTPKIIDTIRKTRKDIFLVSFKTTCGASEEEQYRAGLNMLKRSSSNLVLANDVVTRVNMIITPEEAAYHVSKNRDEVLENLIQMAHARSRLTFTRSEVLPGEPVPWNSKLVPQSLRTVVDYCIQAGAYKPFRGSTAGHFAIKIGEGKFLTSRRKTNFNEMDKVGLVKVEADGKDRVISYGSRPSVGGQSQRIVFEEHPEYDCIVHFHCPTKEKTAVPVRSQREFECGSHECGANTSQGLKKFGEVSAVFLDNHGPNIVFNRKTNPKTVIDFIEQNFNLREKTGGYAIA